MKAIRYLPAAVLLATLLSAGNARSVVKDSCQSLAQTLFDQKVQADTSPSTQSGGVVVEISGGGIPPAVGVVCPTGLAWHAENEENLRPHSRAPISSPFEECWIVGQMWHQVPVDPAKPEGEQKSEVVVFGIRPRSMIFVEGHLGGTAWFHPGDEGVVRQDLQKQERELAAIYQKEGLTADDIWVVLMPDNIDLHPPLITEIRTESSVGTNALGTINGPAIVESAKEGKALVVKLNQGQSRDFPNEGTSFPFPDQASLDARWETHLAEFKAKHPDGVVEG